VTHYEVLSEVARKLKEKKFATEVRSILKEEKEHLKLSTQFARENSSGS
jgi:rubrerythrin